MTLLGCPPTFSPTSILILFHPHPRHPCHHRHRASLRPVQTSWQMRAGGADCHGLAANLSTSLPPSKKHHPTRLTARCSYASWDWDWTRKAPTNVLRVSSIPSVVNAFDPCHSRILVTWTVLSKSTNQHQLRTSSRPGCGSTCPLVMSCYLVAGVDIRHHLMDVIDIRQINSIWPWNSAASRRRSKEVHQ